MPGYKVYPVNCDGHSGRKVYVVQDNNYLQVAEVQVYGKGTDLHMKLVICGNTHDLAI